MAGDLYWTSTVLLCHCDGTNGSTTIVDASASGHTFTSGTSAALTTSTPQFGTASINFPANASNISAAAAGNNDFNFGTGQFTAECWVYRNRTGDTFPSILSLWGTFSQQSWILNFDATNNQLHFQTSINGTSVATDVHGAFTLANNTWTHIAADRDASNVLRVYANGAVIASATCTDNFKAVGTSISCFVIGNDSVGSSDGWLGQIDEVRITKGVARYGGAFTAPTAPFPEGLPTGAAPFVSLIH